MDNINILNISNELKGKVNPENLFHQFTKVREQTIEIVKPLEIEDYVVQTEAFMSPPRWHLGHLSWFYDQLLRKYDPDHIPFKENYDFYFNSYYLSFGELFSKSKRGTISRPTVKETLEYFYWVNDEVRKFLDIQKNNLSDEITQLFILGFNHEFQHQELLVYDLQHLLADKYKPVEFNKPPENVLKINKEMIEINGGMFELGLTKRNTVMFLLMI